MLHDLAPKWLLGNGLHGESPIVVPRELGSWSLLTGQRRGSGELIGTPGPDQPGSGLPGCAALLGLELKSN